MPFQSLERTISQCELVRDTPWYCTLIPSGIAATIRLVGALLRVSAIRLTLLSFVETDADNSVNVADIELGAVTQGQVSTASTIVPNRSSRPLRIGCGCTGFRNVVATNGKVGQPVAW